MNLKWSVCQQLGPIRESSPQRNVPISPPRVDSSKGPHRVNRAHWPTKENRQKSFGIIFFVFSVHGKNASDGPKESQEDVFPTNPDLADILGRTDLNFENFYIFLICWPPNFWISRSPDLQISGFPGPQISKFPDLQIPRCPGFQISRRRRRRRHRTNSQIPI